MPISPNLSQKARFWTLMENYQNVLENYEKIRLAIFWNPMHTPNILGE